MKYVHVSLKDFTLFIMSVVIKNKGTSEINIYDTMILVL